MSSTRLEHRIGKAKYGPSLNEVIVGAALSLVIGALLATTFMVTTPVKVVRDPPKVSDDGVVYYAEGNRNLDLAKQWMRKKQLFLEGSSVSLNEDELNSWIRAEIGTPPPAPTPAGGMKATPVSPKPPPALFQVESPNFRVRDGMIQIGCRATLNLESFGLTLPLITQATGRFERQGDTFAFVPEKCYVGSFPVHKIPGLGGLTLRFLLSHVPVSEDIRAAWRKLTNVAVEGNTLRLSMP